MTNKRRSVATNDHGLVLRRFPFGETSLVVHLMTREHGRVHVLAKGAFRPSSGYFAALDLFDTVEARWAPKRGEALVVLSGARVLTSRRRLARDLDRFRAAEAILALGGLGAREGARDSALYRLTETALDALGRASVEPRAARLAYELGFLETMGVGIALGNCASCGGDPGRAPRDGAPFSRAAGGRLCEACAQAARRERVELTTERADVLSIAERLASSPASELDRLRLSTAQATALERLTARFLAWHVEPASRRGALGVGSTRAAR